MYKILLVEDDELVSELYHIFFTSKGCEVVKAMDGLDGLEKLQSVIPDIILLDLMMPRMNGVEMLEKVKSTDSYSHIPVFILSNLSDPKIVDVCYKKGAIEFLVKSQLVPQLIFEKVDGYLKSSKKNASIS